MIKFNGLCDCTYPEDEPECNSKPFKWGRCKWCYYNCWHGHTPRKTVEVLGEERTI